MQIEMSKLNFNQISMFKSRRVHFDYILLFSVQSKAIKQTLLFCAEKTAPLFKGKQKVRRILILESDHVGL